MEKKIIVMLNLFFCILFADCSMTGMAPAPADDGKERCENWGPGMRSYFFNFAPKACSLAENCDQACLDHVQRDGVIADSLCVTNTTCRCCMSKSTRINITLGSLVSVLLCIFFF